MSQPYFQFRLVLTLKQYHWRQSIYTAGKSLRKDIRNLNETITVFHCLGLFPTLSVLCRGELHLEVIIAKR